MSKPPARQIVGIVASLVAFAPAALLLAQQPPLPTPVHAGDPTDSQGRQVGLKDQLRVGLKATTKADLDFIDLVVLRVNQGQLPRNLVDSTFLWARNRWLTHTNGNRLRPMVYFQPALTLRAKAIGVVL